MTKDISPESVERLKNRLAEFWAYDTGHLFGAADDMIDAIFAVLTQFRAETAAAYERAAQFCEAYEVGSTPTKGYVLGAFEQGKHSGTHHGMAYGPAIRALAIPDQSAALDEVKAAAREQGMREAIRECQKVADEAKEYNIPQMAGGAIACCSAILAAIPKGGDA